MYFIFPSLYAHILNDIFLFISAIILYKNFSNIKRSDSYKLLTLTLLMSIAIGIHGLSHLGLESVYVYNPLNIYYNNNTMF
jgi:hypothetical protein